MQFAALNIIKNSKIFNITPAMITTVYFLGIKIVKIISFYIVKIIRLVRPKLYKHVLSPSNIIKKYLS